VTFAIVEGWPRTALKTLERVRAFFRFALENDWIERNPAKLVRGAAHIKDPQKLPFEPQEMERIMEACRKIEMAWAVAGGELLSFVLLLRYSGCAHRRRRDAERWIGSRETICTSIRRRAAPTFTCPCRHCVMNLMKGIKLRPRSVSVHRARVASDGVSR